jgi:hypothetical protein
MRVAILFTDGVGVGPNEPAHNPLARAPYLLSQFSDGSGSTLPPAGARHDVDTTFGLPGRPQSASNQTAIFTARPAPSLVGRHVLGYPNEPLRGLIAAHSIVRRVTESGLSATFANAYPAGYLDALGLRRRASEGVDVTIPARFLRRLKASASTLAMAAGGVELRTLDDARHDEGLTHDVDGSTAARRQLVVPLRSPQEAAEIFWRLSADFTLFEHYLADEAGHEQDLAAAQHALGTFDAFARAVIERRPTDCQVLICSDHGNVEDLSTRSHTRNPVAVLSFGEAVLPPMETVADVGAAALWVLGVLA